MDPFRCEGRAWLGFAHPDPYPAEYSSLHPTLGAVPSTSIPQESQLPQHLSRVDILDMD